MPVCLIILAAGLAYSSSFGGAFVFDDKNTVQQNPAIQKFDMAGFRPSRPVVDFSYALNYQVGGLDVSSYHAVNLAIHMAAAVVLFLLVRMTLRSLTGTFPVTGDAVAAGPPAAEPARGRFSDAEAALLAAAVAVLWAVHPLTTQAVTYVSQRDESLTAMFYLLTLYCFAKGAGSPRTSWRIAAGIFCLLGMLSKTIMVTAPLVALLYDRVFLKPGTFRAALRRSWVIYAVMFASAVLSAALLLTFAGKAARLEAGDFAWWQYALTQTEVVTHYLRLCFVPTGLAFDYYWPVAGGIADVWPQAVLIAALLAMTAVALVKLPPAGFLMASFFIILSPTSSVVRIADPAFEHRMYLPLAAVAALVVVGGFAILRSAMHRLGRGDAAPRIAAVSWAALAVAISVVLGVLTYQRNFVYVDQATLWRSVLAVRPDNPRAHSNLGLELLNWGQVDAAAGHFQQAIDLNFNNAETFNRMGMALAKKGRTGDAVEHYRKAIAVSGDWPIPNARNNLGNALVDLGQRTSGRQRDELFAEAIVFLESAIQAEPRNFVYIANLARAYLLYGRFQEAALYASRALEIAPQFGFARDILNQARQKRTNWPPRPGA